MSDSKTLHSRKQAVNSNNFVGSARDQQHEAEASNEGNNEG